MPLCKLYIRAQTLPRRRESTRKGLKLLLWELKASRSKEDGINSFEKSKRTSNRLKTATKIRGRRATIRVVLRYRGAVHCRTGIPPLLGWTFANSAGLVLVQ